MKHRACEENRLLFLGALFLLFATHWMFYKMDLGVATNDVILIAEFSCFFVFYALLLFPVSAFISGTWAFCGCIGIGVMYYYIDTSESLHFLYPMSYFPALLFMNRLNNSKNKRGFGISTLQSLMMHFYPWVYLGGLLYAAISGAWKREAFFSSDLLFGIVIMLLLCIVYLILMRIPVNKLSAEESKNHTVSDLRSSFLFAVFTMTETIAFLCIFDNVSLFHTVPLLWILNLIFLFDQRNSMVLSLAARLKTKEVSFLTDEKA